MIIRSFLHSWLVTGFVTRETRWISLVEDDLLTLPELLSPPFVLFMLLNYISSLFSSLGTQEYQIRLIFSDFLSSIPPKMQSACSVERIKRPLSCLHDLLFISKIVFVMTITELLFVHSNIFNNKATNQLIVDKCLNWQFSQLMYILR